MNQILFQKPAFCHHLSPSCAFVEFCRYALTYAEIAQKIAGLEAKFEKEFADIHEVLKWLGEENHHEAFPTITSRSVNPFVNCTQYPLVVRAPIS